MTQQSSDAARSTDPLTLLGPSAAPLEFIDMLSAFRACAAERAADPAIFYFDNTITYGDLDRASDALAAWLERHQVGPGARVMIVLQNVPQFAAMTVAAWKLGAIPVPANPMYRPSELARIMADAEPAAVLCFGSQLDAIRAALREAGIAPAILATSTHALQARNDLRVMPPRTADTADCETFESVVAAGGTPNLADTLSGDDTGLILYTSGTTGVPKGAMLRHRSIASNAQLLRDQCRLSTESRILAIAPFFHITGLVCHICAAFSARAAMVLHYRVEPSLVLDTIREHRPTFTIGAITAFNALALLPDITPADMVCFDAVYSGGAPIAPALLDQIERRTGVKIHSSYGMTETAAPTHLTPFNANIPVDTTSGALSIGKLVPGCSARIVSDSGEALPPGEVGELMLRGPQIMAGYWRKPEETAATLEQGWLHRSKAGCTPATSHSRTTLAGSTLSTGSRTASSPVASRSGRARSRMCSMGTLPSEKRP